MSAHEDFTVHSEHWYLESGTFLCVCLSADLLKFVGTIVSSFRFRMLNFGESLIYFSFLARLLLQPITCFQNFFNWMNLKEESSDSPLNENSDRSYSEEEEEMPDSDGTGPTALALTHQMTAKQWL